MHWGGRALDLVFTPEPPPPPDFGEHADTGLYRLTHEAVEYPVLPPFSWLIEHVVLPNFTAFGWLTLLVESVLAVLLLTGTAVRLAALIGVGQSIAIGLSTAEAPGEWPWAYAMQIGIHLVLLLTPCAQYAAVDAVRAATARGVGAPVARRLLCGWGTVLAVTGFVALVVSLGNAWRAPLGGLVGYEKLEFSLGSYNLVGALVLLAASAFMLAAALARVPVLASAAVVLAAAAAVSIYVQLGRTDVWLGATATTAAVFVCAAVVAAATRRLLEQSAPATDVDASRSPETQGD
ncbi:Rv1678 family membrane protein [Prescottella agglutinans]|uniref:Rv1678 family membrane protein n=1 Tax=Prescottella agglutinans TaxID=1644129 RepID=UPI003D95DA0B